MSSAPKRLKTAGIGGKELPKKNCGRIDGGGRE